MKAITVTDIYILLSSSSWNLSEDTCTSLVVLQREPSCHSHSRMKFQRTLIYYTQRPSGATAAAACTKNYRNEL